MTGGGPEPPTPPEADEARREAEQRRRRIRNWALLTALLGLAALFYAIAMVRMAAEAQLALFPLTTFPLTTAAGKARPRSFSCRAASISPCSSRGP